MFGLTKERRARLSATESYIGAMIGVGIFGLPFVFVQAGFFVGLAYLIVLGLMTITLHLMIAEVALNTPGRHRLPGYIARYFGKKWGVVSTMIAIASSWGALIAYVLVGGEFAHSLLAPILGGSLFIYQLLLLCTGFLIALRGLKFVAHVESYLVGALVITLAIIIVRGFIGADVDNYLFVDHWNVLLPYGVVLFALGGVGFIPEMVDMLGRYKKSVRMIIPAGMVLILILYALFIAAVVGTTGANTSPEAIAGLGEALGSWVLVVGSLFGLLAVSTSFLMNAVTSQDILEYDMGFTRLLAWFVVLCVPVILFMVGARDFIEVMGFTGGVFGGLTGVSVVALYLRTRKRFCTTPTKCFYIPKWLCYGVLAIFLGGVIVELIYSIFL